MEQVDLEASTISVAPEDTKTEEPRLIVLTSRAKEALRTLPSRFKKKGFVFVNPKTKTRRADIKKSFRRALAASDLPGLWFHDLRRSFITRARRVGVPESVVMRMSGHRTRAVFERASVRCNTLTFRRNEPSRGEPRGHWPAEESMTEDSLVREFNHGSVWKFMPGR